MEIGDEFNYYDMGDLWSDFIANGQSGNEDSDQPIQSAFEYALFNIHQLALDVYDANKVLEVIKNQ